LAETAKMLHQISVKRLFPSEDGMNALNPYILEAATKFTAFFKEGKNTWRKINSFYSSYYELFIKSILTNSSFFFLFSFFFWL